MEFAYTGDRLRFECLSKDKEGLWHRYYVDLEEREGKGVCTCEAYAYSPLKETDYFTCKHISGLLIRLHRSIVEHLAPEIVDDLWKLLDLDENTSHEWENAVNKHSASIKNLGLHF